MNVDCGCCSTPARATFENRPGLSAIAYRLGTFATFRRDITDELSRTYPLAGLTARASDDYTLTAIELWSAVADVITFYQERTANEAFLRTATLRDSVLRLVRLIDYQLRPGAAATAQVAFALEPGTTALVPERTRVQSVPAAGESPQKFETLSPLSADARLNRLRVMAAPTPHEPLTAGATSAIAAPDAEAIAAAAALAPGDRVIVFSDSAVETLTVRDVQVRDDMLVVNWQSPIAKSFDSSVAAYKLGRSPRLFGADAPEAVVVSEVIPNTTNPVQYRLVQATTGFLLEASDVTEVALEARYPGLKPEARLLFVKSSGTATAVHLADVLAAGDRLAKLTAPTTTGTDITVQTGTVTHVTLTTELTFGGDIRDIVVHELVGERLRFSSLSYPETVSATDVVLPGRRVGWSSVEVGRTIERGVVKPGVVLDLADLRPGRPVALVDASGAAVAGTVVGVSIFGNTVGFGPTESEPEMVREIGLHPEQVTSVKLVISAPVKDPVSLPSSRRALTVTIGALPPQRIVLDETALGMGTPQNIANALQAAIRGALPQTPAFANARATALGDEAGQRWVIAVAAGVPDEPIAFSPAADDLLTVVALGLDGARAQLVDGLLSSLVIASANTSGSVMVAAGVREPMEAQLTDVQWNGANEANELAKVLTDKLRAAGHDVNAFAADDRVIVFGAIPWTEPRTFLRFALRADSPTTLNTASAVVLGNVAPASHGETVRSEVLGDGDASRAFQRFALKKKPVTFVPDAVPGGVSSSLHVSVSGVEWREVPSLYGRAETDEVFITRIADDDTMTVEFGDGITGARPATGRQNVTALYREGIGLAGRVGAGKLMTLLDRPTGVKGATNPLAADGGADHEPIERARGAAPGTVRTFGRAVSIRDFEDTALLAGELAKVAATYVWTGTERAIHLTVAAQGGAKFSPAGLRRLAATLAAERDPNRKLLIDNYVPVPIRVDATLTVDQRYLAGSVLLAARAALFAGLSFEGRRFGEPVYLSDVIRTLQDVGGVVAVDVNVLDLKNTDSGFRALHGVDDNKPQPQPTLLMLPAHFSTQRGVVVPAELAVVEVPSQDVTLRTIGGSSV